MSKAEFQSEIDVAIKPAHLTILKTDVEAHYLEKNTAIEFIKKHPNYLQGQVEKQHLSVMKLGKEFSSQTSVIKLVVDENADGNLKGRWAETKIYVQGMKAD